MPGSTRTVELLCHKLNTLPVSVAPRPLGSAMRDYLQQACCQEPLDEKPSERDEKPSESQSVKKPTGTGSVPLARTDSDSLPTPCTAPDMPVKKPSGVVRAQALSIGGHLVWAKAPLDLRMLGGGKGNGRGEWGAWRAWGLA